MRNIILSICVLVCARVVVGQTLNGGGTAGVTPSSPCGDSSHALSWNGSVYGCQAITGSAAAGGTSGQGQYNSGGALAGWTATGDCTIVFSTGAITCTKSNGTAFGTGAFATIANYAPLASPTFTGTVNGITASMVGLGSVTNNAQTQAAIVPNTAPSAGQLLLGNSGGSAYAPVSMSQDCTITSAGVLTCLKTNNVAFGTGATATIANYAALAGATFTGEVKTPASTTSTAGLNIGVGSAPTSPANGDLWSTTAGVYARVNGATVGPFGSGGGGVSGGTQNYIPLFGTSTTITGDSHLDDGVTTASTITSSEPFTSTGAVTGSSIVAGSALASVGSATGIIAGAEGSTAGTPTSGQDYIRWDSTLHGPYVSLNGGAEFASAMALTASNVDTLNGTQTISGTKTFSANNNYGTPSAIVMTNATGFPGSVCVPGSFAAQVDSATVTWAIGSVICANASLTFTVHSGSRTLDLTGLVNGGSYVLQIKQDTTGGEGLTLGTGCTWKVSGGGSGAITPSTGANAIDVLAFTYDGTNCYLNFAKNFD